MKQALLLTIIYIIIIIVIIVFLWKFTNRGFSRRVLSDVAPCPFGKEKFFPIETLGEDPSSEGLICFSLYGNFDKYAPTLYKQLDDIPKHLPTWQARVYVPIDTPTEIINEILNRGGMVIKMNGGNTQEEAEAVGALQIGIKGHEAATWRFLGATQVKPFITLDADDDFDPKLPSKIDKWLNSGKAFFIFKPWEILLPMAAGRWGSRGVKLNSESANITSPIPDMLERINDYCEHWFGFDEAFLKKEMWPRVRKIGVYKSAYWPINEILIFSIIAIIIASTITLKMSKDHDMELVECRRK